MRCGVWRLWRGPVNLFILRPPVMDSWHVVGLGLPENSAQCLARVAATAIGGTRDEKVRNEERSGRCQSSRVP